MTENDISKAIGFYGSTKTTYNSGTKKLILNFVNPKNSSIMFGSLQTSPTHFYSSASWGIINPVLTGNYFISARDDASFLDKAKQSFCSTTSNPSDCLTKVTTDLGPTNIINFTIDNFKAYGIKKVVTGLEEEIKFSNTRTLIGIYNSLGQKLDADQTHEGLVIKMYSDGTKEKVIVK